MSIKPVPKTRPITTDNTETNICSFLIGYFEYKYKICAYAVFSLDDFWEWVQNLYSKSFMTESPDVLTILNAYFIVENYNVLKTITKYSICTVEYPI
jgi:hypothetical protein